METPQQPKLLDCVRQTARCRHLSHKTEKSYLYYIRGFILFHQKRHPRTMGAPENCTKQLLPQNQSGHCQRSWEVRRRSQYNPPLALRSLPAAGVSPKI
ncbi:phage integrase N-terminal SAM-like domain-containing protein [Spirulina major]|uniref:phage integrase N-terminal SAM-like domain-containing protein n=1 Tax=Spirulina major TaxID=270636 RepID=UPI003B517BDE